LYFFYPIGFEIHFANISIDVLINKIDKISFDMVIASNIVHCVISLLIWNSWLPPISYKLSKICFKVTFTFHHQFLLVYKHYLNFEVSKHLYLKHLGISIYLIHPVLLTRWVKFENSFIRLYSFCINEATIVYCSGPKPAMSANTYLLPLPLFVIVDIDWVIG